jgi:tRNA G37 N-methylase Trm5
VVAIDIDPLKIDYARHNAAIYRVDDQIDFIVGDFFVLAPKLKVLKFPLAMSHLFWIFKNRSSIRKASIKRQVFVPSLSV